MGKGGGRGVEIGILRGGGVKESGWICVHLCILPFKYVVCIST